MPSAAASRTSAGPSFCGCISMRRLWKALERRAMADRNQRRLGQFLARWRDRPALRSPRPAPTSPHRETASRALASKARAIASRCCSPPDRRIANCRSRRAVRRDAPSPAAARAVAHRGVGELVDRAGIGDGAAQRADRNIGPLRQQHQARLRARRSCPRRTARCRRSPGTASTCRNPTGPPAKSAGRAARVEFLDTRERAPIRQVQAKAVDAQGVRRRRGDHRCAASCAPSAPARARWRRRTTSGGRGPP